ncbi:thiamine phosphate synthase [Alsobacter metallidurans]|nr:thiamine phosphate synthase [Alsobacter metallidurans]
MTADAATARLVLMTPPVQDADGWPGTMGDALLAAVAAAPVDAVLLRLPKLDERSLLKALKPLIARLQEHNVAVLIEDAPELVARSGADGAHVSDPAQLHDAAEAMKTLGRMVGVGNLRARHDAMEAAEEGTDYVLFGEPRRDGSLQPLSGVLERAQWWAELFQTPCIAYAPTLDDVAALAATGCEFVALGDAVFAHPGGPAEAMALALAALRKSAEAPAR